MGFELRSLVLHDEDFYPVSHLAGPEQLDFKDREWVKKLRLDQSYIITRCWDHKQSADGRSPQMNKPLLV